MIQTRNSLPTPVCRRGFLAQPARELPARPRPRILSKPCPSQGLSNGCLPQEIANVTSRVLSAIGRGFGDPECSFGDLSPIASDSSGFVQDSFLLETMPAFSTAACSVSAEPAPKKRDIGGFVRTSMKYGLKQNALGGLLSPRKLRLRKIESRPVLSKAQSPAKQSQLPTVATYRQLPREWQPAPFRPKTITVNLRELAKTRWLPLPQP